MKLKEPKYFVVAKNEYEPRPEIILADWETDLSFGKRGVSYDCVRYSRSTGTMFSKNSHSWKKFDNKNDAFDFYEKLLQYHKNMQELINKIMEQGELMHNEFKK